MTDRPTLDRHGERAARELARRLEHIVPPTLLADPYAFAVRYVQDLITEHWRYIEPPLPIQQQLGRADPPNDEWHRAKEALTRKDHP